MSIRSQVIKCSTAFGLTTLVAGCQSNPFMTGDCMGGTALTGPIGLTHAGYSEQCGAAKAGNIAIASDNPQMRVLGVSILEKTNPVIASAAADVRTGKGPKLGQERKICETIRSDPKTGDTTQKCSVVTAPPKP